MPTGRVDNGADVIAVSSTGVGKWSTSKNVIARFLFFGQRDEDAVLNAALCEYTWQYWDAPGSSRAGQSRMDQPAAS